MQPTRAGSKRESLLLASLALFVSFFVAANFLGSNTWEFTLFTLRPSDMGLEGETFVATAGILAFPLTFILTDIVNEYFGMRVVRTFTWLAIAVNLVLQPIVMAAAAAPTVSFTPGVDARYAHGAYALAFGTTWTITIASLVAFAFRFRVIGRALKELCQPKGIVYVAMPNLFCENRLPANNSSRTGRK